MRTKEEILIDFDNAAKKFEEIKSITEAGVSDYDVFNANKQKFDQALLQYQCVSYEMEIYRRIEQENRITNQLIEQEVIVAT